MIVIDSQSRQPIYEQICTQIKNKILSGELKQEEMLPSVRTFAKELRVSALTVKKAYDALEQEGFIVTVHGKGSFVSGVNQELRMEENLPMTSVETDSYVAVQLLEQQKTLDFDSLQSMAEKVEGSFVFTVLDKNNSIWFVVGDNPLCVMFYDGFLIYASTQEILCKTIKKLRLKAPTDILEPQDGEIMKIDRNGRITTGTFTPHTTFEHWWRKYPFYRSYYEDTPTSYDDLFSVAKAFGVTADEVQALLDYGCTEEEIEEMLYDPELFHEMTGELLYAY
mgnify:CR=1 FL=1